MTEDLEKLMARKEELQQKLASPEVLLDSQKIKQFSLELSLIEKKMKHAEEGGPVQENLIMEIRAGVGGEEAALFAHKLFTMYTRFAQKRGWQVVVINQRIGGCARSDL